MDSSFGPAAGNCGNANVRRSLRPSSIRHLIRPAATFSPVEAEKESFAVLRHDALRVNDVAVRLLAKIRRVGELRVFVPVGGEHAPAPGAFKRNAESADAAKKVNEA
jgi:hypothetical protein